MMHRALPIASCCLALLAAQPAQAARPFATEDAGVIDAGKCELESYLGVARQRGSAKVKRWWVQPACGLGGRSQLALGGGVDSGGGSRSKGLALLGKTALNAPSDEGINYALAYSATAARASGDRWRHESTSLALVATVRHWDASWSANLGWSRDMQAHRNGMVWALGVERPVLASLDAGVEVFGDDREAAWLGVGLRWRLSDGLSLDASYARQTNSARASLGTVGIKLGW